MTNHRKAFIEYFFKEIAGLRYAFMKYISPSVSDIPGEEELRILIDKTEIENVYGIISVAENIKRIRVRRRPLLNILEINFSDGSFLELYLMSSFMRRGMVYMSANEVLNNAYLNNENIKIPKLEHNFEYILLTYLLNGKSLDARYRAHFATYTIEARNQIFYHVRHKYDLVLNTLDDLYLFNKRYSYQIKNKLFLMKANKFIRRTWHYFMYVPYFTFDIFLPEKIDFKFHAPVHSVNKMEHARHNT